MSSRVRTGVIGVGYLGRFHAEKYANNPDAELVGVVDADPARAAEIAKKHGTRSCERPEDLFGKVDALSIVAPTVHHFRIARRCLEEGISLLVEKPVAQTIAQADELVEVASKKGLVLQVGHIERFNPAFRAIRGFVRSPKFIQTERRAPFTVRCTDVNVVLDLMIHDLDIVCDLAGSRPMEVSACGASLITREIDVASARIVFENGAVADVTASRISDEKKRVMTVYEGDSLYAANYHEQTAAMARRSGGNIPQLQWSPLETAKTDMLNDEIDAFVHCVARKERPLVSGVEGRRALALAQVITDSIQNNVTEFVAVF